MQVGRSGSCVCHAVGGDRQGLEKAMDGAVCTPDFRGFQAHLRLPVPVARIEKGGL